MLTIFHINFLASQHQQMAAKETHKQTNNCFVTIIGSQQLYQGSEKPRFFKKPNPLAF